MSGKKEPIMHDLIEEMYSEAMINAILSDSFPASDPAVGR
jgi:hypothetical protein